MSFTNGFWKNEKKNETIKIDYPAIMWAESTQKRVIKIVKQEYASIIIVWCTWDAHKF